MNQNNNGNTNNHNRSLERELGAFEQRVIMLEKSHDNHKRETEMKLDKFDTKIDQKFKEVDIKLDSMKNELNRKIDHNFKAVINNFNATNSTIDKIDEKLDNINTEKFFTKGFIKAITVGFGVLVALGGVITIAIKIVYPHL